MVQEGPGDTLTLSPEDRVLMPNEELYLDLLKRCLTGYLDRNILRPAKPYRLEPLRGMAYGLLKRLLDAQRLVLARYEPFDEAYCINGGPARHRYTTALTMIGMHRLEQLRQLMVEVMRSNVPGDVIETGVWRGGATIFMRAVLKAYGDTRRTVWAADSFAGLPPPNLERYPQDSGADFHSQEHMVVPIDQVKTNFAKFGLLDNQVRFLQGWFGETLPNAPIEQIAVLRLDGDMYESTMDALQYLYPKVSPGGYVIVDDYSVPFCRAAITDYRRDHGITEPLEVSSWPRWAVYWRRQA